MGVLGRPRLHARPGLPVQQAGPGRRHHPALRVGGRPGRARRRGAAGSITRWPKALRGLQAAAAVGQGSLMAGYARLFADLDLVAAQILLTQDDFVARRRFVNAQRTFERLLSAGAIPVVNENDTVATEEITFGDNDRLAALVAIMIQADLLVQLSDVAGIYTRDPRRRGSRLVAEVRVPLHVP